MLGYLFVGNRRHCFGRIRSLLAIETTTAPPSERNSHASATLIIACSHVHECVSVSCSVAGRRVHNVCQINAGPAPHHNQSCAHALYFTRTSARARTNANIFQIYIMIIIPITRERICCRHQGRHTITTTPASTPRETRCAHRAAECPHLRAARISVQMI